MMQAEYREVMKLDDFESTFRASIRARYTHTAIKVDRVALVSDCEDDQNDRIREVVGAMLAPVGTPEWQVLNDGAGWKDIPDLVELLDRTEADLVVTWRGLRENRPTRFTLGSAVDFLTQATTLPVLVIPDPTALTQLHPSARTMVVTDHLVGDDRLVDWGVAMTTEDGHLYLAHVEDSAVFERYSDAISKITGIDTDVTIEKLKARLLKEPRDYIDSIAQVLQEKDIHESAHAVVTMGHALGDYKNLVTENDVDLLICNTKDEGQEAMHGIAHALAIELQELPLLLL